jgi:hypothetical protein
MTFSLVVAAVLALGGAAVPAPIRPNAQLTPGVVATNPTTHRPFTAAETCAIRWGLDHRHVTLGMKKTVFAAYGIPWAKHSLYEVDHLISRELGGADDVKNLFPEPWHALVDDREMGAHQKDRLENAAHRAICAGTLSLAEAQRRIRTDWTALYRDLVGPFPSAAVVTRARLSRRQR